jgi:hypothetical protein
MLSEKITIIVGKNHEHIKYALNIFKEIAVLQVIDLSKIDETTETKLKESDLIRIFYAEDDIKFREKWPEIYAEKKPICMNLTDSMSKYKTQKSIHTSFNAFFKDKAFELMNEVFPKSRSPDPSLINRMCVMCNKRELIPVSVAVNQAPVCNECNAIMKGPKRE